MDVAQVLRKMAADIENDGVREWKLETLKEDSPQPITDQQGRIISVPLEWDGEYYDSFYINPEAVKWLNDEGNHENVRRGSAFITIEASLKDKTRHECIQRIRSMDGYQGLPSVSDNFNWLCLGGQLIARFETEGQKRAARESLTPKEIEAFEFKVKG